MTDWPHYEVYERDYERRHSRLDQALYGLCSEAPRHEDFGEVRAKVVIVGRSYASGVERHASDGLDEIVESLLKTRRWLDPEIRFLRRSWDDAVPTAERIERIAVLHKRLQDCLPTRSEVRSFVSKYLHFHAPVVPIFDNFVNVQLKASKWYRWTKALAHEHPCEAEVDPVYWKHCVRTARIVADWRKEKHLHPTARKIDYYVMRWRSEHRSGHCRACGT